MSDGIDIIPAPPASTTVSAPAIEAAPTERTIHDVVNDLEQVGRDIEELVVQTKAIHATVTAKQDAQAKLEAEYQALRSAFEAKFLRTKDFMSEMVNTIKGIL